MNAEGLTALAVQKRQEGGCQARGGTVARILAIILSELNHSSWFRGIGSHLVRKTNNGLTARCT